MQEAALETFSLDQGVKFVSSTSMAQQSLGQASPSGMAGKVLAELAEKLAALAERVEALQNRPLFGGGQEGSCSGPG